MTITREHLDRIIPRLDAGGPNPIDPVEHCCEYTLYRERERIHAEFAELYKAAPQHDATLAGIKENLD